MAKGDWRKRKITLSASRMEEDAILAQKKFIIEDAEPARSNAVLRGGNDHTGAFVERPLETGR